MAIDYGSNPFGQRAAAHCVGCGGVDDLRLVDGDFACADAANCADRVKRSRRRGRSA